MACRLPDAGGCRISIHRLTRTRRAGDLPTASTFAIRLDFCDSPSKGGVIIEFFEGGIGE